MTNQTLEAEQSVRPFAFGANEVCASTARQGLRPRQQDEGDGAPEQRESPILNCSARALSAPGSGARLSSHIFKQVSHLRWLLTCPIPNAPPAFPRTIHILRILTGLEVAPNDSHQLPGGLAANAAHSGPSSQSGQQVSRNNRGAQIRSWVTAVLCARGQPSSRE
jgi:hypothetical protein